MNIEKNNTLYNWVYFFFSPLIGAYVSIKNFRELQNPNILWAFVVFFGFTFATGTESQGSDIVRYALQLKTLYQQTFTFEEGITYFLKSGEIDVMRIFIALVLSRFTDSTIALTTVYTIIFGYFFSRNMFYLLNQLKGKIQPWTWVLFLVFFLIVPYWNVGGFRFWTATHIFIFGLLPYLYEGKKKYLWFCFLPLLFHFSFLTPLFILLVFKIIPKNITVLFVLFVVTSFINQLDVTVIKNAFASVAPNIYVERMGSYMVEDRVENLRSGTVFSQKNWYTVWYAKALSISIFFSFCLLYFQQKKAAILTATQLHFFGFALFFYAVANILSSFPSGGRFLFIAGLVSYFFITFCYQNVLSEGLRQKIYYWNLPLLVLFVLVSIRTGFYYNSLTTVCGNPIIAFFISDHFSLNDVIK